MIRGAPRGSDNRRRWNSVAKVKTRLAKTTGDDFASDFYNICSREVIAKLTRQESWTSSIAFWPPEKAVQTQAWLDDYEVIRFEAQSEGTLGKKIWHALSEAIAQGATKVVLTGTDIPDISATTVREAFKLLDNKCQVVLGPAKDGGFYLIGTSVRPDLAIFEGVRWSTETVLADISCNFAEAGIVVDNASLPVLQDIDTFQDLHSWLSDTSQKDSLNLQETVRTLLRNAGLL